MAPGRRHTVRVYFYILLIILVSLVMIIIKLMCIHHTEIVYWILNGCKC